MKLEQITIKFHTLILVVAVLLFSCGGGGGGSNQSLIPDTDESGTNESDTNESDTDESDTNKSDTDESDTNESDTDESDTNESDGLLLIDTIDIWNVRALGGKGDIVAIEFTNAQDWGTTSGYDATLNIYQQDPASKDNLFFINSVYLGVNTLYKRTSDINVNEQWITVTLNHNDTSRGWVAAVSLLNHPTYSLDVFVQIEDTIDRAVANGDWLLAKHSNTLKLYDISDRSAPSEIQSFPMNSSITNITAFPNGFLLFTQNGYSYLDLSNTNSITLADIPNIELKGAKKSYFVGDNLYISGPSKNMNMSMVAKLDITDPLYPAIEFINHDISGEYRGFAFDAISGCYYVVTNDVLYKYGEEGSLLKQISTEMISIPSMPGNSFIHSVNERLYIGYDGMEIWKY